MAKKKPLFFFLLLIPVSCIVCGVSLLGAFGYMDYCGFPGASVATNAQLSQIEISAENADSLALALVVRGDERQELAFSPNDKWLLVSGRTSDWIGGPSQDFRDGDCVSVWIIDLEALNVGGDSLRVLHQDIETLLGPSFDIAVGRNSEFAVLGNRQVVDLETGTNVTKLDSRNSRYLDLIVFSPDGRYLTAADGLTGAVWSTDNFMRLNAPWQPRGRSSELLAFVDQDVLYVSTDQETLDIWGAISGEVVDSIPSEIQGLLRIVDTSPMPQLIAYTGYFDSSLYVTTQVGMVESGKAGKVET